MNQTKFTVKILFGLAHCKQSCECDTHFYGTVLFQSKASVQCMPATEAGDGVSAGE